MDTMAQFTLSHIILIIVPCRDNGVNTTRNVAPRGIFCIFVSTFGQYVKTACKLLFFPAEHILQTFYFCYCHSRFAFILSKQNSGLSLVGKASASDNPLSCVLFHLRGAISSFCAAYRITFYLRQSAGRYNRSVLLLRQPTLYHPC